MPDSLDIQLRNLLQGDYSWLPARLSEIDYTWNSDGIEVVGRFFYLPFQDGAPSVDDFVTVIHHTIANFCIPKHERDEYIQKLSQTGDTRYAVQLTKDAEELFIRARNSESTTGEPGELILFLLLEGIIQAPQVVSKMYLKTNTNVAVHGSDGIHVKLGVAPNSLELIWGESKLHQRLSQAIDDIFLSVNEFVTPSEGRATRQHDIKVLRRHITVPDGDLKEQIKSLFDPYETSSNQKQEAFACFAGFNYNVFRRCARQSRLTMEDYFRRKYTTRIDSACRLFSRKCHEAGLNNRRFYFFLIPFPSVEEIRAKFLQKLPR